MDHKQAVQIALQALAAKVEAQASKDLRNYYAEAWKKLNEYFQTLP